MTMQVSKHIIIIYVIWIRAILKHPLHEIKKSNPNIWVIMLIMLIMFNTCKAS